MKLVAVIPAFGREPLLQKTVARLKTRQTLPLHEVVVVGQTDSEREAVEKSGGRFFKYKNDPLGEKWQYGIDKARELGATDILIMGSSDWISDRWCEIMTAELQNGYDLIGKKDIFFLDVRGNNRKRLIFWTGYSAAERRDEPIGTGRIISGRILDIMGWKCFDPWKSSLDWSTYQRILKAGGKVKTVETEEAYGLSISCDKWANLHDFSTEQAFPGVVNIANIDEMLRYWFSDAANIFGRKEEPPESYDETYSTDERFGLPPDKVEYFTLWGRVLELISPAERIVEFGCGPGHLAQMALEKNLKYSKGIDFSKVAVAKARERNRLDIFVWDDVFKNTKADCDVIVMVEVLEHLKNDLKLLEDLPPGRKVIASVPPYDAIGHVRTIDTEEELRARYGGLLDIERVEKVCLQGDYHDTWVFLFVGRRCC